MGNFHSGEPSPASDHWGTTVGSAKPLIVYSQVELPKMKILASAEAHRTRHSGSNRQ